MTGHIENAKHPELVKGKIAYLREKFPDGKGGISASAKRVRVLEVSHLPTWVQDAIRMHDTDGMSWRKVAEKKGKAPATLQDWVTTPGARKMRAAIKAVAADPIGTVRLRAKTDADWAYTEAVKLYRECVASGDRATAARLLNYFADISAVKEVPTAATGAIIQINLQGATFTTEMPQGDSEATKVIEAEVTDE